MVSSSYRSSHGLLPLVLQLFGSVSQDAPAESLYHCAKDHRREEEFEERQR
jgi:hypothetical protein